MRRPAAGGRVPKYRRAQPDARRAMLIDAALRCLAREGIQGFTIDRISGEAGVSRGLINHYFTGKDGLLVEVYRGALYETVSRRIAEAMRAGEGASAVERLGAIVEVTFAPEFFARDKLNVWLALWGEIASNSVLAAAHRELYGAYRGRIAEEIVRIAAERGAEVDADRLAMAFLALVDGLWLEWCLDEAAVDPAGARAAALGLLEARLGPLETR
jgi:TetR/AcrR family transcriptional repressor of bet genes